ncbi:MAG: DNA primase, partial [Myxococcales bacterium]
MQIPPEKIQEIIDRTDLVAVVSRHVELKRSGNSHKGLCPFHGEKTPSFYVFGSDRGRFKCFGCDAGGDAIAFVQRIDGKSFLDAVKQLAKEAGVTLEEREDPLAKERAQLYEANEVARRHFEERLWSPAGQPGRAHLKARGVSDEIARRFHLGYALNSWDDLSQRLAKDGILEWGAKAGLCAPRKSGEGFYDVFRGRLTVPIRAVEGRTVAFGARLIEETPRPDGDKGPKYLNSRETPVYRKSETLYALDLARDTIRQSRSAVLVEGYFDAIGLFTAGVTNAVALCSTALTQGHLAALTRVGAQELVLLLDGDAAGQKAVERLAGPILAAGARARVASLPAGDDPDTFAAREGRAAVERLIASAAPLTEHLLERALPRGSAAAWEEKVAALKLIMPVVEQMPEGLERTLFVEQIARHLGVAVSDVKAQLRNDAQLKAAKAPRP